MFSAQALPSQPFPVSNFVDRLVSAEFAQDFLNPVELQFLLNLFFAPQYKPLIEEVYHELFERKRADASQFLLDLKARVIQTHLQMLERGGLGFDQKINELEDTKLKTLDQEKLTLMLKVAQLRQQLEEKRKANQVRDQEIEKVQDEVAQLKSRTERIINENRQLAARAQRYDKYLQQQSFIDQIRHDKRDELAKEQDEINQQLDDLREKIWNNSAPSAPLEEFNDSDWHKYADILRSKQREKNLLLKIMFGCLADKLKTKDSMVILREHLRLAESRSDLQENIMLIIGLTGLLDAGVLKEAAQNNHMIEQKMVMRVIGATETLDFLDEDEVSKDFSESGKFPRKIEFLREVVNFAITHFSSNPYYTKEAIAILKRIKELCLDPGKLKCDGSGRINVDNLIEKAPGNPHLEITFQLPTIDKDFLMLAVLQCRPILDSYISGKTDKKDMLERLISKVSKIKRKDADTKLLTEEKINALNAVFKMYDGELESRRTCLELYQYLLPCISDEWTRKLSATNPVPSDDHLEKCIQASIERLKEFSGDGALIRTEEYRNGEVLINHLFTLIDQHLQFYPQNPRKIPYLERLRIYVSLHRDRLAQKHQASIPAHLTHSKNIVFKRK